MEQPDRLVASPRDGGEYAGKQAQAYYAHSGRASDRSDWQTLSEHLLAVGELAARHAAWFGASELARVTGQLHDLGKYTAAFQARLSGAPQRVDHATWGARIACQRYAGLGHLMAYAIAGHHAGLADGALGTALRRTTLQQRLATPAEHPLDPRWQQEIALPPAEQVSPPEGFTVHPGRSGFQLSMLGRMLFSSLVDADFVDTENYYLKLEGQPSQCDLPQPSLQVLRDQLCRHMAAFPGEGKVNAVRAAVLRQVCERAKEPTGLFSLTVPTGGGKTLASLAFALDHAIAHGLRRVIFVIPFTSIVEQNAAVFRHALGEWGEAAVLEHHSAFVDDPRQAREARDKVRLAMENWDAPIVVTTAVQFFESLFADRPSRCRKLHNIAGSVVILDEAQTLPPKLLKPTLAAIEELAFNYRTSIVLCTATQPGVTAAEGFRDGLREVRELAPDPASLYAQLKRVEVRHAGVLDDAALVEWFQQRQQLLCIVNNRRHARALFDGISAMPGARHLTTLMCAKHRSEVLAEIRDDLHNGRPCRLVATSLIEAGVDVSFPELLRAEAGLDSLAQAAGRCNRHGELGDALGKVWVFAQDGEGWAPPPELKQFAQVFREVYRKHSADPLSLAAIGDYFAQLYWHKGDNALDQHALMGLLAGSDLKSLPFETLATKYRIIESTQLPVIVPFDEEARAALRELAYAEGCAGLARRLQPYLVQLPRQGYAALLAAGAIAPVQPLRFGDQFMQLSNPALYDKRFGLSWDDPTFMAVENLIV